MLLEEVVPQGIPVMVAMADMLTATVVAVVLVDQQGQAAVVVVVGAQCLYMALWAPFMLLEVVV
jgi:hypothetical protein